MNKKIWTILIVLGICVLAISSVNAFDFGGSDLVEVKDVGLYPDYRIDSATASAISQKEFDAETYGSTPAPEGFNDLSSNDDFDIPLGMIINLTAKDTIKDVTVTKLQNIEITYQDGSVQKVGNFTFDETNTYNEYAKNQNYSLPCIFNFDQSLWNGTTHFVDFCKKPHVKGEIVVDTPSESNKIIGHLDNDITSFIT